MTNLLFMAALATVSLAKTALGVDDETVADIPKAAAE